MNKLWSDRAWDDYLYWQFQDKKTLKKINDLIKDIERNGLSEGIGKPEPLKYKNEPSALAPFYLLFFPKMKELLPLHILELTSSLLHICYTQFLGIDFSFAHRSFGILIHILIHKNILFVAVYAKIYLL